MTKIYLTRHGQTEWNVEKRMQGHHNSNLTVLGQSQAKALGRRLKDMGIDAIHTSSLQRTQDTSRLICGDQNIPIYPHDELREIYLGSWEGKTFDEVEQEYPEQFDNFWHHPDKYVPVDGETFEQLRKRVGSFLYNLAHEYQGKTILVVAHGIVIKALYTYLRNQPIADIANTPYASSACLCEVDYEGGTWNIQKWNDTDHYKYIED